MQPTLPDVAQAADSIKQELDWVRQHVSDKNVQDCQSFWMTAPGPSDPGSEGQNKFRQRPYPHYVSQLYHNLIF